MSETRATTEVHSSPAEVAVYDPPRFWWLKRISAIVGLLLVVLSAADLVFGIVVTHRLENQVRAYRAAGEPIYPADFAARPVPDEDNAAILLEKAEGLLANINSTKQGLLQRSPKVLTERMEQVRATVERYQQALQLLRAARGKPGTNWPRPLSNLLGRTAGRARWNDLAGLACAATVCYHETGNDAEAMETVRDMLDLADRLELYAAVPFGHVGAAGARSRAIEALQFLTPHLRISDLPGADCPACRPVLRSQVVDLVAHLLDERTQRDGYLLFAQSHRAAVYDTATCLCDGTLPFSSFWHSSRRACTDSIFPTILAPAWKLNCTRAMEDLTQALHAGLAEDYPAARELLAQVETGTPGLFQQYYGLQGWFVGQIPSMVSREFRGRTSRRAAAQALAIRLFELEHGRLPATLSELVPEYLPALPLDPFAADGRTFGYRPDAPRPFVYSVSIDGTDEGGAYTTANGRIQRDMADMPFFLDGGDEGPAPAPAPVPKSTDGRGKVQRMEDEEVGQDHDQRGRTDP